MIGKLIGKGVKAVGKAVGKKIGIVKPSTPERKEPMMSLRAPSKGASGVMQSGVGTGPGRTVTSGMSDKMSDVRRGMMDSSGVEAAKKRRMSFGSKPVMSSKMSDIRSGMMDSSGVKRVRERKGLY